MINYLLFLQKQSERAYKLTSGMKKAWFSFSEVKQTWLGFSLSGNNGCGMGNDFANSLYEGLNTIFKNFGEEKITKGRHIEKLCLISPRVGRDKISDFTTNFAKYDFFDQISDRSTAEEILEGTLLVAQKEYEERKLHYIANLYANIAFNKDVSREIADKLIKISSELTYRQLMIMSAVGFSQIAGIQRKKEAYKVVQGLNNVSIASETFDLYRKSLLFSSEVILDAGGINPSKLTLGGYGALLYNLMELSRTPFSDTCMIDALAFLGISVPNT